MHICVNLRSNVIAFALKLQLKQPRQANRDALHRFLLNIKAIFLCIHYVVMNSTETRLETLRICETNSNVQSIFINNGVISFNLCRKIEIISIYYVVTLL